MARVSRKSIYERIEDQKNKIKEAEDQLAKLNEELKELYKEQDAEEMLRMLEAIRNQGIDIETALSKLTNINSK